jgi:MFS family permease
MRTSLEPFRRPRLRGLLLSQFVADMGDGVVSIALPLYVYALTESASATALTFVGEVVLGMVLSLVGGVLADRRDRRLVLLTSYAIRVALLLAMASVARLWPVLVLGMAARAMGLLDNPSFDALVPGLADGDLQQVVAARRITQGASLMVGPGVGGVAVALLGVRTTLVLASCVFVGAFVRVASLRGLDTGAGDRRADIREGESASGFRAAVASAAEGLRITRETPMAVRLLIYWACTMATVAMVIVLALVWFEHDLHVSKAWYGISVGGYGVGTLVGLAWAGGRSFKLSLPAIMLRVIPLYAVLAASAVLWHTPWLMLVSWFGWGVAMGPEIVVGETALVSQIPEAARGRVSAAQGIITQFGLAVGYGISGPLVDTTGARATNFIVAGLTLALVAFWIGPYRRERRATSAVSAHYLSMQGSSPRPE